MTTVEIPTVTTGRLRLRAFRADDLDAYSAMQGNPEVMRHMVMGRTSTRAEVWRTMLMSMGSWALRSADRPMNIGCTTAPPELEPRRR